MGNSFSEESFLAGHHQRRVTGGQQSPHPALGAGIIFLDPEPGGHMWKISHFYAVRGQIQEPGFKSCPHMLPWAFPEHVRSPARPHCGLLA